MLPLIVATIAVVVSAIILRLIMIKKRRENRVPFQGLPSLPNPHWIFGHMYVRLSGRDFRKGWHTLAVEYADNTGVSTFLMFSQPCVSVLRAKDVKAVLNSSAYRVRVELFDRHYDKLLGPKALFSIHGKEWKFYRSTILRAFSVQALQEAQAAINKTCSTLATSLIRKIESNSSGIMTVNVLQVLKLATFDAFGLAALDIDFKCCENLRLSPVGESFEFLLEDLTRRYYGLLNPFAQLYFIPTPTNIRSNRERVKLRKLLHDIIESRRVEIGKENEFSGDKRNDMLSNLIRACDQKSEVNDGKFDDYDDAISDLLLTMLFAGYDTTSITVSYILHMLSNHPEVEELCYKEACAVLGTSQRVPSSFDPEKLHYIRAVMLETLRLYPPAPITVRDLERPFDLNGITLPAGTRIFIPLWFVHRQEMNFPRPHEFLPERWVKRSDDGSWEERFPGDDNDDADDSGNIPPADRDAFFAFAAGARSCAGRKFAVQETVTMLAVMLRDLKFETVPGYVVEPEMTGPVQKPRGGIPMQVKKR